MTRKRIIKLLWSLDGLTDAKSWDCKSRPRSTTAPMCRKKRWVKQLRKEDA